MSFFKKIVSKLTNQPIESEKDSLEKLSFSLKDADLDYKFAQLFTYSGGYFNYCGDEAEALHTLNQIIKIEDIQSVFCFDEDLQSFLDVVQVKYTEKLEQHSDAAFITCEYLIAFDGKIVLSSQNILHYQSNKLPEKIIIIANVSQIVTNLNEAMAKIKKTEHNKNLTSISGSQTKLEDPNVKQNKLFLLLLED